MNSGSSLRRIPSRALAVAAALAGILSWAALYVSVEKGRTTPLTVSLPWLTLFLLISALSVAWLALYWFLLALSSGKNRQSLLTRTSLAATLLLLSVPCLIAVYGSDNLNHYLLMKPVARLWLSCAPFATRMASELAAFVWVIRLPASFVSWLRQAKSVPILLFVAFACLYLFSSGGHLYSPDEKGMYQVTESIVRGSLATWHRDGIPSVVDGKRLWDAYGLVPSLIAAPLYWTSGLLGVQLDPPSAAFPIPNVAYPLVDLLVSPLATAATCALLYAVARQLGFRVVTSLILVMAYGLGTSTWVYSKTFFGQPTAALFLLASTY